MLTPELAEQCVQAQRQAALDEAHRRQLASRAFLTSGSPAHNDAGDDRQTFAGGPLALGALQQFDR